MTFFVALCSRVDRHSSRVVASRQCMVSCIAFPNSYISPLPKYLVRTAMCDGIHSTVSLENKSSCNMAVVQ